MLRRLASVVALTMLVAGGTPAAHAQDPVPGSGFIRVASISPWTDPATPMRITLQLTNPTEAALSRPRVHVIVHGRVFSRSQLRLALEGNQPTGTLGRTPRQELDAIPPGGRASVTVETPMSAFRVSRNGVYPIEIRLDHDDGAASVRSAMPYFHVPPPGRLNLTWILPVTRPTIMRPGGVYDGDGIARLGAGELQQQLDAVAAQPVPVSLAIDPSLAATLADLSDGYVRSEGGVSEGQSAESVVARAASAALASMRVAAEKAGEVLTVPYAKADLAALSLRGLRNDVIRQITTGRTAIETLVGRTPTPSLAWLPTMRADARVAETLRTLGITGLVLDPATLPAQPTEPHLPNLFGPSRPVPLRARTPVGLLVDAGLRAHHDGPPQGALQAQAIIAETASSYLELPGIAPQRLLVMTGTAMPPPTTIAALTAGLAGAPWLTLRTASDVVQALPPTATPHALPATKWPDRRNLAAARTGRRLLRTVSAIAVGPLPDETLLERELLLAESAEWGRDPAPGEALANAVVERTDRIVRSVRVPRRQVTLTSSTGVVPVTIVNRGGLPLRLLVRIDSPRISTTEAASKVIEVGSGSATVDFEVEARAAGAFPLTIRLETPDGETTVARGEIIVRSTAVSRVTLLAVIGGFAFLVFAYLRRSRRNKRTATG